MSDNLNFDYEGLNVSIIYNLSANSVKRIVTEGGKEIYQDELKFDKSLAANFELMSTGEQENLVTAWGAAGIKTRIEDGQFGSKK